MAKKCFKLQPNSAPRFKWGQSDVLKSFNEHFNENRIKMFVNSSTEPTRISKTSDRTLTVPFIHAHFVLRFLLALCLWLWCLPYVVYYDMPQRAFSLPSISPTDPMKINFSHAKRKKLDCATKKRGSSLNLN